MGALGENTIVLDCDVLQADGGTRTAAITGAYVALADAISWGRKNGAVPADAPVLTDSVAAVSVGIVDGVPVLDLPYVEDVRAETDMNVVVTGSGGFVEVQGTAERHPVRPQRARRAAGPGRGRDGDARPAPGRGARGRAHRPLGGRPVSGAAAARRDGRCGARLVLATHNRHKLDRAARDPGRGRRRPRRAWSPPPTWAPSRPSRTA